MNDLLIVDVLQTVDYPKEEELNFRSEKGAAGTQ